MFFFDSETESEGEEVFYAKIKRRYLRDNSNPFELSENDFVQQFRVNKECFKMILSSLDLPQDRRRTSVPPVLQLCATLNLLASGSYQTNVGTNVLLSMAQTTVSKFFRRTLSLLENKFCPQWIKFDCSKFRDSKEYYYRKFKLPGIVGCVDGTHIPILRPKENEHIYFNRKGFHSLNAMVICNHLNEIIAINSSHGGAAHDSAVWNCSNEVEFLKQQFHAGEVSIRLLG
ncbi:putative nuclease HARBI1 [Eupeodes corollae]|uniref:putative nuclease HARBI1 n=1 Tax=Eupeodes corollae TaxID=290404 RepID=UPI0024924EAB|nr:putative nuclease HARBI1 [Eupeodes corollae]